MNRNLTVTGGLLISQTHLKIDIDALTNAVNSIAKAFKESNITAKTNYIVYGCTLTQNGTSVELSEGMVFINDEFFIVDAATILNKTVEQVNLYNFFLLSSNIIRPTFKEGSKVVAEIRKAVLLESSSVGTKLDTDVYSAFSSLNDRITIPDASIIEKGKIQIADLNEVLAGTDTLKAVTPATLKSLVQFGTIKIPFLGTWNMDTTSTFGILLGIQWDKIVGLSVYINPTGTELTYPIERAGQIDVISNLYGGGYLALSRTDGGFFDSVSFNNATGWVLVQYITN